MTERARRPIGPRTPGGPGARHRPARRAPSRSAEASAGSYGPPIGAWRLDMSTISASVSRRSWHCAHARAKVVHLRRTIVELGYAQRRDGRRETRASRASRVGLLIEENVIFGGPAVLAREEKVDPPVAEEGLKDGARVVVRVQGAIGADGEAFLVLGERLQPR